MYAILCARTAAVMDATTDSALVHERARRYSRDGTLYLVRWHGATVAAYRDGISVEMRMAVQAAIRGTPAGATDGRVAAPPQREIGR
jgi:hypothetical protein